MNKVASFHDIFMSVRDADRLRKSAAWFSKYRADRAVGKAEKSIGDLDEMVDALNERLTDMGGQLSKAKTLGSAPEAAKLEAQIAATKSQIGSLSGHRDAILSQAESKVNRLLPSRGTPHVEGIHQRLFGLRHPVVDVNESTANFGRRMLYDMQQHPFKWGVPAAGVAGLTAWAAHRHNKKLREQEERNRLMNEV